MYELAGTPPMMSFDPSKGINPQGGKSYFVREGSGGNVISSDDNEGTDPQYPLATVQAALNKCVASMGDYVFVLYFSTIDSPPITIPVRTIHLIAVSSGNFDSRNDLNGGGTVALRLTSDGRDFELAGFNVGAGGTGAGDYGLEVEAGETGYRFHIHHCTFGNNFDCLDGIHMAEFSNASIDHCMFGSQCSQHGIYIGGGVKAILAHNIFHKIPEKCIYYVTGAMQCFIFDNMFAAPIGEADGWAIDLCAASVDCLVMNNSASECGDATQDTGNPYRDRSAASLGAKKNQWAGNKVGNDFGDPKATV